MQNAHNEAHNEKGQSLVEFAFGMVILMLLVVGIVDGGRAIFTYLSLRDAAQEGAVYGSTDPTSITKIKQHVLESSDVVSSWVTSGNINVQINGDPCIGNEIQVSVSIPDYPITTPFVGAFIGSQTIPIRASVSDTILAPYACP